MKSIIDELRLDKGRDYYIVNESSTCIRILDPEDIGKFLAAQNLGLKIEVPYSFTDPWEDLLGAMKKDKAELKESQTVAVSHVRNKKAKEDLFELLAIDS
jgi:hypothetical protein